jgi:Big-like domain-containing protein
VAAESQRLEARAVDAVSGEAIVFATFSATAEADVPVAMVKVAGDGQAVTANAAAPESLAVRLADKYDNPVPNYSVAWTVQAGSGQVSPPTGTTTTNGIARTRWTVGAVVGRQEVGATAGATTPVSFAANVVTHTPTQYVMTAPATAPGATTITVSAQLADAAGTPVEAGGRVVTWDRQYAFRSFSSPQSMTNASGVATVSFAIDTAGLATSDHVIINAHEGGLNG